MAEDANLRGKGRADMGFYDRCDEIIGKLASCYASLMGKNEMDFISDIFSRVPANDSFAVEEPSEIVQLLAQPSQQHIPRGRVIESPIAPIIVSSVFLCRAKTAYAARFEEQGWCYLADASYWCGVSQFEPAIEPAYQRTVAEVAKKTNSNKGASGGNAAAERRRSVIDYAYSLIRGADRDTLWPSVRQAALAIRTKVLERASATPGANMSHDQAERTISGWLSKMPDRDKYIKARSTN